MDQKIAVLFMPDNIACTEEKTPLMLQPILFCPVLTWMCAELCGRGIERLFIVSDVSAQERMKPYLPKEADVTFVDGAKHAEELLKLLEGETGSILIVNGVVLPVGVFSGGAVYSAPADACCAVLREHGAFAAFPKGCEISKGFLPVGDTEELRAAQPMCRQKIMEKHLANGVIVMDTNSVYIDPRVKIGVGKKPCPDYDLAAWVLGKFPAEDQKAIDKACEDAVNAAACIIAEDCAAAAQKFNGKRI